MIDWYYHAPGEGRVGPLSAEELRKRFRERHIQRDTLVWHHDLREWQPLERLAPEIGLESLHVDASKPPSLPPEASVSLPATAATSASALRIATAHGKYSRTPPPPKKHLSTGALVGIGAGVAAMAVLGVVFGVVVPGYRKLESDLHKLAESPPLHLQISLSQRAVRRHFLRNGRCPSNQTAGFDRLVQHLTRTPETAALQFMTMDDGTCGFRLTVRDLGPGSVGGTIVSESFMDGGRLAWDCTGGTLPESFRPPECRASSYE